LTNKKENKKTIQKEHQKDLVKIVESKTTSLRWHLGQVGHGPFGVFLLSIFLIKKRFCYLRMMFCCLAWFCCKTNQKALATFCCLMNQKASNSSCCKMNWEVLASRIIVDWGKYKK
jgi:hypothetical protein